MNISEPRMISKEEYSKLDDSKVGLVCECTYFTSGSTFGHIVDKIKAYTEGYQCSKCGITMKYGVDFEKP